MGNVGRCGEPLRSDVPTNGYKNFLCFLNIRFTSICFSIRRFHEINFQSTVFGITTV